MHLDGMDLNLLVALDALLSEKSVTRAASRLCVTQPAMSIALSKLRTQFSDRLLERVGRQMEVTPFGLQLTDTVRELLFDIRSVLNRQSEFDPSADSRSFRLLMSSSVAEIFGIPALRSLRNVAPGLRYQIDIFMTPDLLRRLQDGEIDLAVQVYDPGFWEPIADAESLASEPLFCDDYVVVADRSNHLIHAGMSFENFCSADHVETRFGGDLRSTVERTLSAMPIQPQAPLLVSTYALAIDAIIGTSMTAIVPRKVAERSPRFDEIAAFAPPFKLAPLNHKLIWHRRNDNDPAHLWLRNFMKNFVHSAAFTDR
jgi:LysR family nod box-dependent transcriptional activator